jgi:sec-independent protein translocase protein TatB
MFGIGLPEMIVILAVALIVVGPDKLPDLARSVAKTILELKKTVNQVKNSLADEEELLGSVKSDLNKAAEDLKGNLLEADQHPLRELEEKSVDDDIIEADDRQPEPEAAAADTPPSELEAVADTPPPESKAAAADTPPPEPDASPADEVPERDASAGGDPDAAKK